MKYKLIGIAFCIFAMLTVVTVSLLPEEKVERYHQHLDAEAKEECHHGADIFCTHLPLVEIDTGGVEIPGKPIRDAAGIKIGYTMTEEGEADLPCRITVTDHQDTNNHIEDVPEITSDARIRIRGNSSRDFVKSNYLINLVTGAGENNSQAVMGMDAHHEWALHGPVLDKTLIRNYMWYNIAGEIMGYAPNVRFCEVIINGEYRGLYVMTETITAGKDGARLNLSVDKKDNSFAGYCLRLDRGSESEIKNITTFSQYTYRINSGIMNIEYPGTVNLTKEMAESIRQDFSAFEKTIYSFDYDNSVYGYSNTVDVDSFVDYFIVNEFTCNYDAGSYSTYIYKDLDGKYHMCVWDFNNSCDNYQEGTVDRKNYNMYNSIWYFMLVKDEDFTKQIIKRYRELRENCLSEEYLMNYVDETIAYLGAAIDRNFEVWGYTFAEKEGYLYPATRNPNDFDDAVDQLKTFIQKRGEWLDENIDVLLQHSAESKTKLYNEHTE